MNTAIGCIEEIRINKRNIVKYLIKFKGNDGKIHQAWSNWTSQKSYDVGASVPIKYRTVPGTFGMGYAITEIDDLPQYSEGLAKVGIGSLLICAAAAGFVAGKLMKDKQ